jgi:hypothetical protein
MAGRDQLCLITCSRDDGCRVTFSFLNTLLEREKNVSLSEAAADDSLC